MTDSRVAVPAEVGPSARTRRRRTLVVVTAIVLAIVAAVAFWATRPAPAFVDAYDVSSDGLTLHVRYAPAGSCAAVLWERVHETDDHVTVDISSLRPLPLVPTSAVQELCEVNFQLDAPLGDRPLTLPSGETVEESWASVGR